MTDRPIRRTVTVTWSQMNMHHWPGATGRRYYLSQLHRHQFHYEATVTVDHNDREIEFHDLLDFCRAAAPTPDTSLAAMSCEDMAEQVLDALVDRWPDRTVAVSCFEDGEVGACLSTT